MDYNYKTTLWQDFTIAEMFGESAIRDTYERVFNEWKSNTEYITELVMVLNHKIWAWYQSNEELAKVYNELWKKADLWCTTNLKDEDLTYFYRTTD